MTHHTIKEATEKDKPALIALGRKIVDVYERTHLGDAVADGYLHSGACDRDLAAAHDHAHVILDGEQLRGFIIIRENHIEGLCVDVPYWGTGMAQSLLAYAESLIAEHDAEVVLECFEHSPRANRFYQKMGFTHSGLVDGDGGRRILYKKSLSSPVEQA